MAAQYAEFGEFKLPYEAFGTEEYHWEGSLWKTPLDLDWFNDHPEPYRVYLFHMTLGHHGILSLTPIFLFSAWGGMRLLGGGGRFLTAWTWLTILAIAGLVSSTLAYIGWGRAYIKQTTNLLVIAHELGHNFGLLHAASLRCTGAVVGGACTSSEYGDPFDVMGNIGAMHFNSMQKSKLGWIAPSTVVTQSAGVGAYSLAPLELAGGTRYAVTVPITRTRTYWAEYRQPLGFDAYVLPESLAPLRSLQDVLTPIGATYLRRSERPVAADIALWQVAGVPGFEAEIKVCRARKKLVSIIRSGTPMPCTLESAAGTSGSCMKP